MANGKKSRNARRKIAARQAKNASSAQIIIRPTQGPVRQAGPTGTSQSRVKNTSSRRRAARRGNISRGKSPAEEYLQTLIQPEVSGVRIPDMVSFPSSVFQLVSENVLSTGTGGDSVAFVLNPIVGDSGSPAISGFNGTSVGSLGTVNASQWAQRVAVSNIYRAFRPVSAVIEASFIGPTMQDGGQIMGALVPRGITVPTSYGAALGLPNSWSCPLRDGIRVIWKPQDNADMEYQGAVPLVLPPYIYIAATGLPSAVSFIKIRAVCNFEAIVQSETLSVVESSDSPIDLIGFTRVLQQMSQIPAVRSLGRELLGMGATFAMNRIGSRRDMMIM